MKEKIQTVIHNLKLKIKRIRFRGRILAGIVGALLLLWGVSVFIFSQEDSGVTAAATELSQLADNIRRQYQNRPDYWGLNTQAVIDKKIAPLAMLKSGTLIGYMGNTVTVGYGADGSLLMPGARNFDIAYHGLSTKQCSELAGYKFPQNFWLGVSGISIISRQQETLFTWDDETNQLPISKDKARTLCTADSTIIWHF